MSLHRSLSLGSAGRPDPNEIEEGEKTDDMTDDKTDSRGGGWAGEGGESKESEKSSRRMLLTP